MLGVKNNYHSLSINDEPEAGPVIQKQQSINTERMAYIAVFFFVFVFYGYCVFHTFAPYHITVFGEPDTRRLGDNTSVESDCTLQGTSTAVATGAVGGALLVCGAFLVIGLTPMGPIAGSLFALNMGSGLAAGSMMAITQSAAMTSATYATGAALGAAGCATYTCA